MGKKNGQSFKVVSKTKKKKKMKKLSFITQFKIEFLPLFTSCREEHEQIPEYGNKQTKFVTQYT